MMAKRIVLRFNLSRKLLPFAAALMAVAAPAVPGQGNTPLQAETETAKTPTAQASKVPQWQTAAGGKMSFDVASIRPTKPGEFTPPNFPLSSDDSYVPAGGLLSADFSLAAYIEFAYKLWLSPDQRKSMLASLPKWVDRDKYEIHARASGNPTKDQMRLMMQSLLVDRFKLAIHFENQQVSVLAMTLIKPGKTGPKLRLHADGPPCDVVPPPPAGGSPTNDVFPPMCDMYYALSKPGHVLLAGSRNTTMAMLAASIPSLAQLERTVVDQTGLSGKYDFSIEWAREPNEPPAVGVDVQTESQGTTFLEAMEEQLGLKLTQTKAPLDVLVIDHVEMPSEN
jgi:uncharacterized protein (TIGR03435 family)